MRPLLVFALLFVVLTLTGIVRADDVTADQPTFEELVRQGDLARISGRNSDAVHAYVQALKLRNDPRIAGRLGIVALAGGAPALAVTHLLNAITDGHTIPSNERQQIQIAFDRARPLVSRISIRISHVGAAVTIDDKLQPLGTIATDFYVFRLPGHHEFRASLEGFEDAVVAIDTKKGDTVDVSLVLVPLAIPANENPPEPAPVVTCEPKAEPVPCETSSPTSPKPAPPASATTNHNTIDDEPIRWMPGFGATVLYGAVSPYPAGGFSLSSYWTAGPVFSGGFDVRVAFSPRGIEGYEIRGGTFTLLPGLCATRNRFTGCLTGHLGGMWHSWISPSPGSMARVAIGGGARVGFRFGRIGRFDLQTAVYGELLLDEYPIRSGGSYADVLWTGPPYLTGLSISAVWTDRRQGFTLR